ncbi:DNA-binding protein [Stenotrophomonas maltophilia]|nr:DNA-binding protein [Stenotrophomonas maltophilia]
MAAQRTGVKKLRTPEEARQFLRDNGITVVEFARQNGLDRHAVNDALRGVGKGNFGKSHQAAIALGIKRDPDSCTEPANSRQKPTQVAMSGKAGAAKAGSKKR